MDPAIDNALIQKKILYPGSKYVQLVPGTRVKFHYRTKRCDDTNKVIDDSKKNGKPMELVLGKKFKLEVWEVMVQKMSVNEVAKFTVDKSVSKAQTICHLLSYMFVSSSWSSILL